MSNTKEALKKAITGEFNAIQKYKKFEEVAAKENLPKISFLFKALIIGEQIHLKNHKKALGDAFEPELKAFKLGTTKDNLMTAWEAEIWENTKMYPDLIKEVKKEMKSEYTQVANLSFNWAKDVEFYHAEALSQAILNLNEGKDFVVDTLWVCKVCGNLIVINKPTEICPVCRHDPIFYVEVKQ
jgi:rubrerythrin